jgi:hypothetical protein
MHRWLQVDFDEKSPIELLQVLNDVFSEYEPQMAVRLLQAPY